MRAGAARPSLQGPDTSEGGNSHGAVLPREALVWTLSALTQAFRIPFDENLVTGQTPPPHGISLRLELFLIPHFLNECLPADIPRRSLTLSGEFYKLRTPHDWGRFWIGVSTQEIRTRSWPCVRLVSDH